MIGLGNYEYTVNGEIFKRMIGIDLANCSSELAYHVRLVDTRGPFYKRTLCTVLS